MKKKSGKRKGGYSCVAIGAALLCVGLTTTGCAALRKASDTGKKVVQAIVDNHKVVFETIDGAIGVGEAVKDDVKGIFSKSNTVTSASK